MAVNDKQDSGEGFMGELCNTEVVSCQGGDDNMSITGRQWPIRCELLPSLEATG